MSDKNFGKVLIIGAGPGGLALAQALHTQGVPFEIFERDQAPSARAQAWAIALVECLTALADVLPEETYKHIIKVSVNHNTGEYDELAFVDATTSRRVALFGGKPIGEPGAFIRANRDVFRTFLWNSNSLSVTSGKIFSHCTQDAEGVTAFFRDGSTARGSLLVGADGLNSKVRNSLIGDNQKPVLSAYVPIFGELDLPPEQYEPLRQLANAGLVASGPALRLLIGMLSMADDRSKARFFWALMPRCDDPQATIDFIQRASNEERYNFVMDLITTVHPTLRALIEYGGPEALAPSQPTFREFVTPSDLPAGRVTVLGDAAHGMVPFRGAGANTAIMDACELGKLLIAEYQKGGDPSHCVKPYLEKMIPRGQEAVLSSRAAGNPDGDDPTVHFNKFQRRE